MKIFCDYPEVMKAALLENNSALEFVKSAAEADLSLLAARFPLRIGGLLDQLNSVNSYKINGLKINLTKNELCCGKKVVAVTSKEMEILRCLIANLKGISREEMLKKIWGYAAESNTATVETHIYRLKNKIAGICEREIIKNVDGLYRLVR